MNLGATAPELKNVNKYKIIRHAFIFRNKIPKIEMQSVPRVR